ncbi:hypothetical protein DIPPA_04825, partial [Diplonema papillatum]
PSDENEALELLDQQVPRRNNGMPGEDEDEDEDDDDFRTLDAAFWKDAPVGVRGFLLLEGAVSRLYRFRSNRELQERRDDVTAKVREHLRMRGPTSAAPMWMLKLTRVFNEYEQLQAIYDTSIPAAGHEMRGIQETARLPKHVAEALKAVVKQRGNDRVANARGPAGICHNFRNGPKKRLTPLPGVVGRKIEKRPAGIRLQQARTARDAAAADAAERLRKPESSREAHRADVAAKEESQKAAEAAFQRERDEHARTARDAAAAEAAERLRKLESSREAHRADVAAKEESQKAAEAAFQRERDEHARTVEKLTLGIQALQQDGRAWQQRAESLEPAAVAAQNSSNDLVSARDQLRSSENFRRSETDKYESTIRRLQKKLAESTSRHESLRAVAQQLQLQLQASAPGLGSSTASTTLLAQTLASILAPAAAGSPGSAYWRQPDAFPPVDPFGDNSDPSDDGGGGDNRAYNNDRKATGGDCEYPPVSPLAAPVTPVLSSTYHHHQAQQQARHLQKLRDRQKAALEERAGRAEADAAHRARVIEDLRAQVADHATRNQDLSAQNDRIRAQVRKFTEEMEAEPIVQKTKQLRAEADELRAQLNAKKRDVAALQAHVMDLESAASRGASSGQPELLARAAEELAKVKAELELHKKRSALLEALNDHTTSAAAQHILAETDPAGLARALAGMKKKYEKAKHAAKELAGEGKDLRKRLDRAHADLKRVAAEKRSLLEINNMLRSDLSKLASADLSPQSFSPRTTTALLPSRLAP